MTQIQNSSQERLIFERQAESKGFEIIVGVDEAGRGPLAGPVVAAAVALRDVQFFSKIGDSKTLTPRQREVAFLEIFTKAFVGVGIVNEGVIDSINILEATFLAMSYAVRNLVRKLPSGYSKLKSSGKIFLLIDGNRFKTDLPYRYQTIVGGDGLSLSVGCASIIAKVTRDRILNIYDQVFPDYGFQKHKGYPTQHHREAIKKHGLSPIHRRSFQCLATDHLMKLLQILDKKIACLGELDRRCGIQHITGG